MPVPIIHLKRAIQRHSPSFLAHDHTVLSEAQSLTSCYLLPAVYLNVVSFVPPPSPGSEHVLHDS